MTQHTQTADLTHGVKVAAFDAIVRKSRAMDRYAIHKMVEGLAAGQEGHALFVDRGDHIIVRTGQALDASSTPVAVPPAGSLVVFEVQALACRKVKGSRRWFEKTDWKSRHDWLRGKAAGLGFEVLTVNARVEFVKVEKEGCANLDTTVFTGVLRVADEDLFAKALREGVASNGRFCGLNMLTLV